MLSKHCNALINCIKLVQSTGIKAHIKVQINNNIVQRCPKFTNTASNFLAIRMKDLQLESSKQSTSASASSSSSSALSSTSRLLRRSMKQLLPAGPDLEPSQRSDRGHSNSRESLSACSRSSKSRTPSPPPKRGTRGNKVSPTTNKKKGEGSSCPGAPLLWFHLQVQL